MTAPPRYAFAHRGGRAHGPDNTLGTFRGALSRGASGLETDAWLTADGEVVLDHDGVLRAARRRHRPIASVRRAELPAHVPTLRELYDTCGTEFDLAVDVRHADVAAAIVAVARAYGAVQRLWLVGGTLELLAPWRAVDPDVHLAWSLRLVDRAPSVPARSARAGVGAVNMRWPWWTRRYVQRVHAAGLLAFAYDVQSRGSARRVARLGVDGVFSDSVELLTAFPTR
jgi:glycerophosphoryl diester phosphodiesterase